MTLTDHELACIFPLMSDAELQELADDIRVCGLQEPVWLFSGKILDGRNRYRACVLAEVAPRTQEYKGKDPLAFVISKNLHRRHLTESQRAMVAAEITTTRHGGGRKSDQAANLQLDITQEKAAEIVNVSPRTVAAAVKVKEHGAPELAAAVKAGDVSVSAAAKVATLPKATQRAAVKAGPKAVKEAAKKVAEPVADDEPPAPEEDPAEQFTATLSKLCYDLDAIGQRIVALKESRYAYAVHWQSARDQTKNARETLWGGRTNRECPYCKANGEVKADCRCCRGTGATTISSYKAGVAAVGGGE